MYQNFNCCSSDGMERAKYIHGRSGTKSKDCLPFVQYYKCLENKIGNRRTFSDCTCAPGHLPHANSLLLYAPNILLNARPAAKGPFSPYDQFSSQIIPSGRALLTPISSASNILCHRSLSCCLPAAQGRFLSLHLLAFLPHLLHTDFPHLSHLHVLPWL